MELITTQQNYAAQIVKVNAVLALPGADRLEVIPFLGLQAITAKGQVKVGDLGVFFPTECQLDPNFCHLNNLYSDATKNIDNSKGYIGDNRRVRAITLRGHDSNCLFLRLTCLEKLGIDTSQFKEGDTFNSIVIDDKTIEICRKYVIPTRNRSGAINSIKTPNLRKSRVEKKLFPEHIDTDNFWRNEHKIPDDALVIVTAKYHGTSVRLGNVPCYRKLSLLERIAQFFGAKIQQTEYDCIAGSRTVIKDYVKPTKSGFYAFDIYNAALGEVKHVIPKDYMLFGEIVGWANQAAIQKHYTYQIPQGKFELYIYRIAHINSDGILCDLSWDQVVNFCKDNGLKHVPELWRGEKKEFQPSDYMDKKFSDIFGNHVLPLDSTAACDEGVVIRVEGTKIPYLLKAKSPKFLGYETKALDENVVSLEDDQNGS